MIATPLIVLFSILFVLFFLNVPIFAALGLTSMITAFTTSNISLPMLAQKFYSNISTFPLMAVPFFLLASAIMENSSLSRRIVDFADAIVGSVRGGLALTGLVACTIFATISGSSLATIASIGSIVIPRMLQQGYHPRLAVGSIVAAGTLGIIIPPSIPLIIYGMATGTSVVQLFLAGVIPGLLIALALAGAIVFFAMRGDAGEKRVIPWMERKQKVRSGVGTLIIPIVIFFGIYGLPGVFDAIFTPTEASIVTIIVCIFVAMVFYRDFKLKSLPDVVFQASPRIGMILMIIGSAMLFSFVINNAHIPQELAKFLVSIDMNPYVFLLMVNILLFLAGDFMDAVPVIMIFVPVLFPSAVALGIDPVHFGILIVVNMELGCITPPVGLNLYMASTIAKMSFLSVLKASTPWILVITVLLFVITYIPGISLFLPNLFLK